MKNKKITKPVRVKSSVVTFTWKPPTKEEDALEKEVQRKRKLAELREIGIYLEGMKKASALGLYPLGHSHLSTLWEIINERKTDAQ